VGAPLGRWRSGWGDGEFESPCSSRHSVSPARIPLIRAFENSRFFRAGCVACWLGDRVGRERGRVFRYKRDSAPTGGNISVGHIPVPRGR